MTREEVAEIMNYCKEYKVTYKSRLEELNIPVWRVFMTANPVMPPSNHRVKRLKVSLSSFQRIFCSGSFICRYNRTETEKYTGHAKRIERDGNTYTGW